MSLSALIQLIPPPPTPVYATLGTALCPSPALSTTALPKDLFEFSAIYGSGGFQGTKTTRLLIYNPFSPHYHSLIDFQYRRCLEARAHGGDEAIPFEVFPTSVGILPLGTDDCDTHIYWRTFGEPERWPIVVQWARGRSGFAEVILPLGSFLYQMLARGVEFPCWPEPWFNDEVAFQPSESV